MKAEFELIIGDNGKACISFKHHDKDKSLDQSVLRYFISDAFTHGIKIVPKCGYLEAGTNNSWEKYEIQVNNT